MEKSKRERSSNFNTAEIQLLVSLVGKYKQIIENKKTDAVTNRDKECAWKKIETSFNSCGVTNTMRSWKTLKLKYEGVKKITKKKAAQHRQEMYRTGGGRSDAPDFNEVEEKVLSICSNITGLEARNDSDTIAASIPVQESVHEPHLIVGIPEEQILEKAENKDVVQTPDMNESIVFEIVDNGNDSQKENKWEKWQPKALKSRVSDVLKSSIANKASVTSKLDKLSEARLELVKLQMQTTMEQHKFVEEEHKLKIQHLANDERRKEEMHKMLMEKIRNGPAVPSNIV